MFKHTLPAAGGNLPVFAAAACCFAEWEKSLGPLAIATQLQCLTDPTLKQYVLPTTSRPHRKEALEL